MICCAVTLPLFFISFLRKNCQSACIHIPYSGWVQGTVTTAHTAQIKAEKKAKHRGGAHVVYNQSQSGTRTIRSRDRERERKRDTEREGESERKRERKRDSEREGERERDEVSVISVILMRQLCSLACLLLASCCCAKLAALVRLPHLLSLRERKKQLSLWKYQCLIKVENKSNISNYCADCQTTLSNIVLKQWFSNIVMSRTTNTFKINFMYDKVQSSL